MKDSFSRTHARDRYTMNQVEQMVQQQFHDELRYECTVCAPPLSRSLSSLSVVLGRVRSP